MKTTRTRAGLRAVRSKIQLRGLASVDRRTAAARELCDWKAEVIAALGGEENVSPMKASVIEEAVRTRAYLNHVDAYLLSLESVIDKRARKLRPIVEARMRIGEHLMKQMDRLGLDRVAQPLPAIDPERMEKILAVEHEQEERETDERPEGV